MSLGEKDKYAIKGMVADGKEAEEIAKFLKKSKDIEEITEYVESLEGPAEVVEPVSKEDEEKLEALRAQLRILGVDSDNLVEAIAQLKDIRDKEVGELKNELTAKTKALDLINRKSQGGRDGVAVMNSAASERADDFAKTVGKHKKTPDYIFKPKG